MASPESLDPLGADPARIDGHAAGAHDLGAKLTRARRHSDPDEPLEERSGEPPWWPRCRSVHGGFGARRLDGLKRSPVGRERVQPVTFAKRTRTISAAMANRTAFPRWCNRARRAAASSPLARVTAWNPRCSSFQCQPAYTPNTPTSMATTDMRLYCDAMSNCQYL